jgi:hypothetical protein
MTKTATTEPNRPRVFVSSTIYDFRDLRTALKFWLEELGYEVMQSEFNDFRKELDRNSYESCLTTIDGCDYFILLVGGRVVGWFDAANKVSITQMEYRRAYERLKEARLKLIVFVRQEVWDIREDRKALEQFLKDDAAKDGERDAPAIAAVTNHPSRFVTDAEFVFNFLKEIGRLGEMKLAVAGKHPLPIGNWIHRFTTFRDIVDALRVEFRASVGMRKAAQIANLKAELTGNMRALFTKSDNEVRPLYSWASPARRHLKGGFGDSSTYEGKHLLWLGMFGLLAGGVGKNLKTTFLDEALNSGEFLEFDHRQDSYVVGKLQQAMIDLKDQIERLRFNEESFSALKRQQLMDGFKGKKNQSAVRVPNEEIVLVYAAHDLQANIVALIEAIYRALDGDTGTIDKLSLYPSSPFTIENERMAEERPTTSDIQAWLSQAEGGR